MERKFTINEAKNIVKEHIVFTKEKKNEEAIFFKYTNNLIHVFNSHFSSFITMEDFLIQFRDSNFYIYEEKIEPEGEENKSYYRQ